MNSTAAAHLDLLLQRFPVLVSLRPELLAGFQRLCTCFEGGGTLYLCGNGGSAADGEHIAGELLKGFLLPRRPDATGQARLLAAGPQEEAHYLAFNLQEGLRAVALTGHLALSTAVINDNGGDLVFAQQVYVLGRKGDVLLAISTSGNARNVRLAAVAARAREMSVLLLSGASGGRLKPLADIALCVPEREAFRVQELHVPVYHAWCAMLEAQFFS